MNAHVVYSFDEFRIDPARRELWRGRRRVRIQPKAFECLAYLIEHRDRVVGNDELISAVWGSTDLTDNVVMHSIARARRAVGDSGSRQRAIRTVTRVGYSWNLPVEVAVLDLPENGQDTGHTNGHLSDGITPVNTDNAIGGAGNGQPVPQDHEAPAGEPRGARRIFHPRRWLAAAAALVIAASTVMLLPGGSSQQPPGPVQGEAAIVLPVTFIGEPDGSTAWIRLGIMDFIAERLRELGLLVAPSDNTVVLARTYLDVNGASPAGHNLIEALARTAAAGLVLDARAEAVGDRWRVSLRTVHGREPAIAAQADARDVLAAARAAADRMAVMLGFELAATDAATSEITRVDHVLQQVHAARLSDRFEVAGELLAGLGESERQDHRVRFELAEIDLQRGEYDAAIAGYTSLLEDLSAAGDEVFKAKTLRKLGAAHLRQRDYDQAEQHYRQALDVLQGRTSYEARLLTGQIRNSTAGVHRLRNQFDEAEADYARARIALEISGDQLALARLDANMSALFARMGRIEAITYAERAARRLAEFGDVQNELRARVNLVLAHYYFADASAVLDEANRFNPLLARIGDPALATSVRIIQLGALIYSGRHNAAEQLLARLSDGASVEEGRIQYFGAGLAYAGLDYERAAALAASAVAFDAWEPVTYSETANAWMVLLRAQIRLHQAEQADRTLLLAEEWGTDKSDRVAVSNAMALMRAEHAAYVDDSATALANFEEALQLIVRENPTPHVLIRTIVPYIEWLIEQGDLERAGVLAGRVSVWADRDYGAALAHLRLYHAMGEAVAWRLALERTRNLAGEREIPPDLLNPPTRVKPVTESIAGT